MSGGAQEVAQMDSEQRNAPAADGPTVHAAMTDHEETGALPVSAGSTPGVS
jgi:hypothetical protein